MKISIYSLIGYSCSVFLHGALIVSSLAVPKPPRLSVINQPSSIEVAYVTSKSETIQTSGTSPRTSISSPGYLQEDSSQNFNIQTSKSKKIIATHEKPIKKTLFKEPSIKNISTSTPLNPGVQTSTDPTYFQNPAPLYPAMARKNGWEGLVILEVSINKFGTVNKINLLESSGYSVLDEAAKKTVKFWKFRPARLGNIAIDSLVQVPVQFKIEDK